MELDLDAAVAIGVDLVARRPRDDRRLRPLPTGLAVVRATVLLLGRNRLDPEPQPLRRP